MAGRTFTIPTIFTAIDRLTAPVRRMSMVTHQFADRANGAINRQERLFRKLTPSISDASKSVLAFAKDAAIFTVSAFSAKAIMDYESELQNLKAITGISGAAFDVFKGKIMDVATATGKSSIEVTKAFTMVGNNAPNLLKDAEGLAEVTKQSIILAQASKMELGPSADYLTSIMNQFNTPAKEAGKTINMLAAGANLGSTDINAVSEAMQIFGGVASQMAGVQLPEAVTAIEAISGKMKDASKIGNQFKNIFAIMSSISVQDPKALKDMKAVGLNMKLIESKSVPLIQKLEELKKLSGRKGALEHVFGKEQLQSLIPLLSETEKYKSMISSMTTDQEMLNAAQTMANKNNDSLLSGLDRFKNKWVNLITGSGKAADGLNKVKAALAFVTEHLETIIKVGLGVVGLFASWKAILISARIAMVAYNVVSGIMAATSATTAVSIGGGTVAMNAQKIATYALIAAEKIQIALMNLTPWGIAITATLALAAASYGLLKIIKGTNVAQEVANEVHNRVLENTIEQRVEVTKLFGALRNQTIGSKEYTATLQKIDELQPGIVNQFGLMTGGLNKMARAEAELTTNIMKRAEAQARAELLTEAIKEKLIMQAEGPTAMQKLSGLFTGGGGLMQHMDAISQQQAKIDEMSKFFSPSGQSSAIESAPKEALIPSALQVIQARETDNRSKETVTVDFKNVPAGTEISETKNRRSVIPDTGKSTWGTMK